MDSFKNLQAQLFLELIKVSCYTQVLQDPQFVLQHSHTWISFRMFSLSWYFPKLNSSAAVVASAYKQKYKSELTKNMYNSYWSHFQGHVLMSWCRKWLYLNTIWVPCLTSWSQKNQIQNLHETTKESQQCLTQPWSANLIVVSAPKKLEKCYPALNFRSPFVYGLSRTTWLFTFAPKNLETDASWTIQACDDEDSSLFLFEKVTESLQARSEILSFEWYLALNHAIFSAYLTCLDKLLYLSVLSSLLFVAEFIYPCSLLSMQANAI